MVHFTNYHRVLNRAQWSALQGSRILLGVLVNAFVPPGWPVILGADDTVERRRGGQIQALGCYRDAVRSSKKHTVTCFGLKWLSVLLLVEVPWSGRVWALPVLTVLCPSAEADRKQGRRHKTSGDWLIQVLAQIRRWLPDRRLILVVDGAFAAVALGWACSRWNTVWVSRLRWDARLHHFPTPPPPGTRGRKPLKGARQRALRVWATRGDTPWQRETIRWYGGQPKTVQVFSRPALWYRPGWPPLPIRWVLVRDPEGKLRDEVFFCTDLLASPQQILEWVVMRWSVEVTFEEARAHLGMETQRQWSDPAIARTTPCLLALFSLVTWLTQLLRQEREIPVAATAWYPKEVPTFSDCLTWVRQHLGEQWFCVHSAISSDGIQLPPVVLELLRNRGLLKAA
jgi:hypothetical protein